MSADAPPTLGSRLSDRLNPILVREIQQVLRGRGFTLMLSGALSAICITALGIAMQEGGARIGREAFVVTLVILTPIATFLIPLQAFMSMQQEVRGGTGEQLLLSQLTPQRIVRGKLLASMVQMLLFLSVFGPMLALTFLLRGVDVVSIAFFMVLAVLACLVCTAAAIAAGAISRVKILSSLLLAGVGSGLGSLMIASMVAMNEMAREIGSLMRSTEFWLFIGTSATCLAGALVLLSIVAGSLLTHPNENRSTPFRLFAVAAIAVTGLWMWGLVPVRELYYGAPGLVMGVLPALSVFWLFAVTEDDELSPRARLTLPRNRTLALVAAPLLPGGGRGISFVVLTSVLLLGAGALLAWQNSPPSGWNKTWWSQALLVWLYCFFYVGLARIARALAPRGPRFTWIARILGPLLLVLGCAVPPLIQVLVAGPIRGWNLLHVTNPFWTIDMAWRRTEVRLVLGTACAALALLMVPAAVRGFTGVARAHRERHGAG